MYRVPHDLRPHDVRVRPLGLNCQSAVSREEYNIPGRVIRVRLFRRDDPKPYKRRCGHQFHDYVYLNTPSSVLITAPTFCLLQIQVVIPKTIFALLSQPVSPRLFFLLEKLFKILLTVPLPLIHTSEYYTMLLGSVVMSKCIFENILVIIYPKNTCESRAPLGLPRPRDGSTPLPHSSPMICGRKNGRR